LPVITRWRRNASRTLSISKLFNPASAGWLKIIEATAASQTNVSKQRGFSRVPPCLSGGRGRKVFYSITDPVIFEPRDLVCNKLLEKLRPTAH
jgi:hypothetical protein